MPSVQKGPLVSDSLPPGDRRSAPPRRPPAPLGPPSSVGAVPPPPPDVDTSSWSEGDWRRYYGSIPGGLPLTPPGVSPEVFEGIPDAAALTTLNFVEHTTREHRDAHVE